MVSGTKPSGHRTGELLDAMPPCDDEAERGLLAALLLDGKRFGEVSALVRPDDLRLDEHQQIARHIWAIAARGSTPDAVLVAGSLKDAGQQGHEPGQISLALLGEIMNGGGLAVHAVDYARRVAEKAVRRSMLERGRALIQAAHNGRPAAALMDAVADLGDDLKRLTGAVDGSTPIAAGKLMADHPRLHDPLIHGLLRRGETMNVIAAPKVGKSWLTYGLALSVATGTDWLGQFPCEPDKVLLIDNELHAATLASRLRCVADAMGLRPDDYTSSIDVLSLRGNLMDLHSISRTLDRIEPGTYSLVVLDAWYRAIPAGASENDNAAVAQLYNAVDAMAARLDCAWINIHHTSKGSQTDKSVTDVGAGAGSQSRAADAHLVLRPHEQDGVVVLDAVVRSFAPVEPVCLRWQFPVWMPDADADASQLKGRLTRNEERSQDRLRESEQAVAKALADGPKSCRQIRALTAYSQDRCQAALDRLEAKGEVAFSEVMVRGGKGKLYSLSTRSIDPVDTRSDESTG